MGKALPGALLIMWEFLSDDLQDALLLAVEKNRTAKIPIRGQSVRPCPHCGNSGTMDCARVEGISDATVGLCLTCGYIWCLECDASLITGIPCGHWQICAACGEKKKPSGFCGTMPLECRHIQAWLEKNHPVV